MKNDKTCYKGRHATSLLAVAAGLLLAAVAPATPDDAAKQEAATKEIQVYFDDLEGTQYDNIINVRDDLLQNAFADAADHKEWIGDYEFEYNELPEKDENGYLLFTVTDWERSRSNFYSFSAKAKYVDPDGQTHDLGTVNGYNSGIAVIHNRDIGDHFSEVAESAIREALEKLEKRLDIS